MIRFKSLVIFIIGVALSIFLYVSHGNDTSLSNEGFFSMMVLFFMALPTAITGFVLVVRDIDQTIKKMEKNFLSISYNYLKLGIGILFILAILFIIVKVIISPPLTQDPIGWIWLIVIIGVLFRIGSLFILGAYRKLKDE